MSKLFGNHLDEGLLKNCNNKTARFPKIEHNVIIFVVEWSYDEELLECFHNIETLDDTHEKSF
jgi:hypothetical protein